MTAASPCFAGGATTNTPAAVVSAGSHADVETMGIELVSPGTCACSNQRMELEEKAVAPGRRWQPGPPHG